MANNFQPLLERVYSIVLIVLSLSSYFHLPIAWRL